jgi:hypothetical protein
MKKCVPNLLTQMNTLHKSYLNPLVHIYVLIVWAKSADPDQPAHPCHVIWICTVHFFSDQIASIADPTKSQVLQIQIREHNLEKFINYNSDDKYLAIILKQNIRYRWKQSLGCLHTQNVTDTMLSYK